MITLGAHGCYGASADESRLRRLLRDASPRGGLAGIADKRVLVPAFECKGEVNSVRAHTPDLATCSTPRPPAGVLQRGFLESEILSAVVCGCACRR